MRILLPLLLALLALASGTQAQSAALELGAPTPSGEGADGIYATAGGRLAVPWTLTFDTPVTAAAELGAEGGSLAIELVCDLPATATSSPVLVTLEPGQAAYSGVAELVLDTSGVVGYTQLPCTVGAEFTGTVSTAGDSAPSTIALLYEAQLDLTTPTPSRVGGPQKMLTYPIELGNGGAAPMLVRFELAGDGPPGRWAIVLPEPVLLDAGMAVTAPVVVATDYRNGPNDGAIDFTVRAVASHPDDPGQTASFVVPLHAGVKGLYVPGPPLGVLLAVVALAAMGLSRRA